MIRNFISLSEQTDASDVNFILFNSWEDLEALGPNVIKYWFYLFKPSFHLKQKSSMEATLKRNSLCVHPDTHTHTEHLYTCSPQKH